MQILKEYSNGNFTVGPMHPDSKCEFIDKGEEKIEFDSNGKIINYSDPLIAKYPNFFSSFFQNLPKDSEQLLTLTREVKKRFDTIDFEMIQNCRVDIRTISCNKTLLGIAFFINSGLLDLDKLPKNTPLKITEEHINGIPLSEYIIKPETIESKITEESVES